VAAARRGGPGVAYGVGVVPFWCAVNRERPVIASWRDNKTIVKHDIARGVTFSNIRRQSPVQYRMLYDVVFKQCRDGGGGRGDKWRRG